MATLHHVNPIFESQLRGHIDWGDRQPYSEPQNSLKNPPIPIDVQTRHPGVTIYPCAVVGPSSADFRRFLQKNKFKTILGFRFHYAIQQSRVFILKKMDDNLLDFVQFFDEDSLLSEGEYKRCTKSRTFYSTLNTK